MKKQRTEELKHMISSGLKCTQWRLNCERLNMTRRELSRHLLQKGGAFVSDLTEKTMLSPNFLQNETASNCIYIISKLCSRTSLF